MRSLLLRCYCETKHERFFVLVAFAQRYALGHLTRVHVPHAYVVDATRHQDLLVFVPTNRKNSSFTRRINYWFLFKI